MTSDLLKLRDLPALKQLARALWHNGSIRGAALMVGAGFSKNAILQTLDTQEAPNWNELLNELVDQLYPTDRSSAPQDPLRIAEEYRIYFGQATLDGFFRTRFPDRAWLPGPLHLQALNFPWSDILTTNWDTLLERTSDQITDFIYGIVRTEADIAHARSPRIIKLHGTLGDKDPLIFATEDYRTYPVRHAAFVNLARQIFIENDLCLLGFSGNDPNFLQWAGWVRDQLGGHARRIYLAGYLDLSVPARRYLEAHNIAPIDFAPLVDHLPKQERYGAATKIFLDELRAEQPPAPHEWKKHAFNDYPLRTAEQHNRIRKDDAFAAETLKETARLFREDRERYPGWLVCPREERRVLPSGQNEWAIFKPIVLGLVNPAELVDIFCEFLWRYTISFSNLPPVFRDALVVIMDESRPPIDQKARLKFAVALMRDARIRGDGVNFEKWRVIIDAEAIPDGPGRLEAHYQRCLHLRDQLNLAELAKSLNALDSEDPLWRLRQAGLYAEVGEHVKATKLIKDATSEFEKAYRLNRNSMWIKSCLAWASWLNRVADMANFRPSEELLRAREFQNDKIDPAGELEALKNSADGDRRREQEDEAAIIPLFDAGSYRPGRPKGQAEQGDRGFSYLYELDRLMECTGAPLRINDVQIAAGAAESIMRITYHHSIRWYIWLLRALHSHFDNLYIRYFSRIAIAQLPESVADELRQKIYAAITFWCNRHAQSVGEEYLKNRSIARDELRLTLRAQSHMTVRMGIEEAVQALQLSAKIAEDPTASHYWIMEAARELAKYALESIPADRRGSIVFDLIKWPFAIGGTYHLQNWPELIGAVTETKPDRENQDTRWDQRIQELLAAAQPNGSGRIESTARLAYLATRGVLKPSERDSFAVALWGKVDDNDEPLPADTGLLASMVADLPAPAGIDPIARVKARILGRDLRVVMNYADPLDTRILSDKQNHLISLYNTGPMGLSIPPERAAELFDEIVAWNPTSVSEGDGFEAGFKQQFNDSVRRWAGEVLTFAVVPAMAIEDKNDARLGALLEFIDRTKSWRAVAVLPNFLETLPNSQNKIISVINGGLSVAEYLRISGATTAMTRWSLLTRTHSLPEVPRRLIGQLLSMIESQREEGLHILLNAAVTLVTEGVLTDEDLFRLMHSLSILREETQYSGVLFDSRRAVSISLVRQQCVSLAQQLKRKISDNGTLSRWLEEGRSDPLPEVRFSAQTA